MMTPPKMMTDLACVSRILFSLLASLVLDAMELGARGGAYRSLMLMKMTATVKQATPMAYKLVSWSYGAFSYGIHMK